MANLEDKGKKESLTGSGFEKKGGFPSKSEPPRQGPHGRWWPRARRRAASKASRPRSDVTNG